MRLREPTSDPGELGGDSLISGVCDGVACEFGWASYENFRPELLSSGVLLIFVCIRRGNERNEMMYYLGFYQKRLADRVLH